MSREFQEHLFESLTREETSTVSGIQGTGLGMAINVSHMVQEIAMELLSNAGFSVSLADDGDVAVETLRTAAPDQFDLVLMDGRMPEMDGADATRAIEKQLAALGIPCERIGPYRVRGVEVTRFLSRQPSTPWLAIHLVRKEGRTFLDVIDRIPLTNAAATR